jgi:hypothetical protein
MTPRGYQSDKARPYPGTASRGAAQNKAPGEDAPGAKSRQGKAEDGDEAFPLEPAPNEPDNCGGKQRLAQSGKIIVNFVCATRRSA